MATAVDDNRGRKHGVDPIAERTMDERRFEDDEEERLGRHRRAQSD